MPRIPRYPLPLPVPFPRTSSKVIETITKDQKRSLCMLHMPLSRHHRLPRPTAKKTYNTLQHCLTNRLLYGIIPPSTQAAAMPASSYSPGTSHPYAGRALLRPPTTCDLFRRAPELNMPLAILTSWLRFEISTFHPYGNPRILPAAEPAPAHPLQESFAALLLTCSSFHCSASSPTPSTTGQRTQSTCPP